MRPFVENLRDCQVQADMDGTFVTVSRQAVDETIDYVDELEQQVEGLRAALTDATDSYEEYAQYAGDYLCRKHGVAEDVARLRGMVTPPEPPND